MIADIFFPRLCLGCGYIGSFICPGCERGLEVSLPRCLYCGEESLLGLTHPGCRKKEGIDGCLSLCRYNRVSRKILQNIKYKNVREAVWEFLTAAGFKGGYPMWLMRKNISGGFLQPIPLHKEKLKERGFNQSFLITRFLSHIFNMEIIDVLERVKKTPPQALLLSHKDRFQNMRGAFKAKIPLHVEKPIVIVDDVVTSGSTVKEAARALKVNGVSRVYVFSVAS